MFFLCVRLAQIIECLKQIVSIHSHHHCSPNMAVELKKTLGTLNLEDVDIMDVDQMQKLLKKIILNMRGAEELAVPEPGEAD